MGSLILGPETGAGQRMTVGFGGIWAAGFAPSDRPDVRLRPDRKLDGPAPAADRLGRLPDGVARQTLGYYTPRFAGLQLGLSTIASPGGAGRSTVAGLAPAATNLDGIALAARFDRRFDRFRIGIAAGYAAADTSDDSAWPAIDAWTVAALFDVSGLRVSGEFEKNDDPRHGVAPTATPVSGAAWNIGATYQWGRNDVSLAYGHGKNRAALIAPSDGAMMSYDRTLGRGVDWSVNLYWAEAVPSAIRGSEGDEAVALTTGLRLNF